jgi:5-methylcytosine-specific restriction endonuclease McrA
MGGRPYRRNRAAVLAESDLCALCHHPGAETADHIVPDRLWPRDEHGRRLPGFNDVDNLQPAHGTMGNVGPHNPCPTCRRLCNQVKGDGTRTGPPPTTAQPRSRSWYTPTATL